MNQLWAWVFIALRKRAWTERRNQRGVRFVLVTALLAVGEALAASAALALLVVALVAGGLVAVLVPPLTLLFAAGTLARRVAVPRGWYRAAYWLARLDGAPFAASGARLLAARAAARVGSPPAAAAWLARRRPARLDATEVVVQGVLAHGRGERDDARALLASVAGLAEPAPAARELAAEWLALDDAERGDWSAILTRGRARAVPGRGDHRHPTAIAEAATAAPTDGEPLWPATPLTHLLEGVAARLRGAADAPSPRALWVRWLEAPTRRATLPLVRAAVAARPTPTAPPSEASSADTSAPPVEPHAALARAARAHGQALVDGSLDALAGAAARWDAVLTTPGLAVAIARRASELAAPADAADRALTELRGRVADELALALAARGLSLGELAARVPGSHTVAAIAHRARRELLGALELACDRVGDRVSEARAIDAIDELRTFLAIRAAYERAAHHGGAELERLAFPHVHEELTSWTVWLWNERHEYLLSHLVSTWLYERARAVGDAEAIELHGKNGALAVPAP